MKDLETSLKLPDNINSLNSVSQLIDELENIEDFFLKMKVKSSLSQVDVPKTSAGLEELSKINNLNLMKSEERASLKLFLHFIRTKAPVVHLSFGAVPSDQFTSKIINWFRTEINPHLLISIGLQPNIGAGFRMRTTNKLYDFSLSKYLSTNKQLLTEAIGAAVQR